MHPDGIDRCAAFSRPDRACSQAHSSHALDQTCHLAYLILRYGGINYHISKGEANTTPRRMGGPRGMGDATGMSDAVMEHQLARHGIHAIPKHPVPQFTVAQLASKQADLRVM